MPSRRKGPNVRDIHLLFWLAGLTTAALQGWTHRFTVGVDVMSYLDLARAYLDQDWSALANACWSPVYPWILALALAIAHPSAYWEYPLVQIVDALIAIGALGSCVVLVRLALPGASAPRVALAHTFCLWTLLGLITSHQTNPDMAFAALLNLACAQALRARDGRGSTVLLGALLGAAYLAKSVLFPLGFIMLALVWKPGRLRALVTGGLIYLAVCGIAIVPMSLAAGRFTFGDAGKLNIAWRMQGVPQLHWQGQPAGSGVPVHPTRQVVTSPATYAFGDRAGTYPPWYDPAYFYEGLRLRPVLDMSVLVTHGTSILRMAAPTLLLAVVIAFIAPVSRGALWRTAVLWLPAVLAAGMYALSHVEGRYLAPWILEGSIGLIAAAEDEPMVVWRALMPIAGLFALLLVAQSAKRAWDEGRPAQPTDYRVATAAGLPSGTRIGSIGRGMTDVSHWAHLARVKIVAEVDEGDAFWRATPAAQQRVLDAFMSAGADVALASTKPTDQRAWHHVAGSRYYLLPLGARQFKP